MRVARLHLVDGTYELFRAHYSKRPDHRAPAGWDAKATVGVAASLLSLLSEAAEAVTHIAVAFDNPIRSFRNDLFPAYKSDEGVDPALRAQFDAVEEATRALGITVWSMREYEADDALATGAARFSPEVDQVRIMTPDKDLGQCLRGERVVQVDRKSGAIRDAEGVRARFGVPPERIPDYLALVGDSADGYPGVRGWGPKTAARLIGQYGPIESFPPETLKDRAEALLFKNLATLRDDAPLFDDVDELRWRGPGEAFPAAARMLEDERLVPRVRAIAEKLGD